MNSRTRDFITDLKAAARLGHPDSLDAVLERFRALPQVASNQTLEEAFLEKVILPAGAALGNPIVERAYLNKLAKDPLAAIRAVAAAALGKRYLGGGDVTEGDLRGLAGDRREEVREALVRALMMDEGTEKRLAVAETWVKSKPTRLQACGVRLLGSVARSYPQEALALAEGLGNIEDPEVRAALAETVSAMGSEGLAEEVLGMLAAWVEEEGQSPWVVAHALAGAWAAKEAKGALGVLQRLTEKNGAERQVVRAIEALKRHGAEDAVTTAIEAWRKNDSPDLREIAKRMEQS